MDRSSVKWFRIDSKVHQARSRNERNDRCRLRPTRNALVKCYVSEYNEQTVPLGVDEENDDSSDDEYPVHVSLAKHGCTNDVRALWLETAEQTPTDRSLLQRKLAEADLQHGSLQRRPRGKKRKEEEEAKKKRRRVNPKFAKLTNTHLAGRPSATAPAALEGVYRGRRGRRGHVASDAVRPEACGGARARLATYGLPKAGGVAGSPHMRRSSSIYLLPGRDTVAPSSPRLRRCCRSQFSFSRISLSTRIIARITVRFPRTS